VSSPPHSGRPPRCPDRFRQRAAVGISKDSHLAAEFDVYPRRPTRGQLHLAARREVVRRHLHRGPGPVVAREESPALVYLYATPPRPSRRRAGSTPDWRTICGPERSSCWSTSIRRRGPGARLDDRDDAGRSRATRRGRAVRRRRARRRCQPRRLGAVEPPPLRMGGEAGYRSGLEGARRRSGMRSRRSCTRRSMAEQRCAPRSPTSGNGPPSSPPLPAAHVALRSPSGESDRGGGPLRVGFRAGRDRRPPPADQRRRPCSFACVNRHDFDQHTGRVISPESMRADLVAMKQFGFNAVRTSHYPNDPVFLDLTDELGLYVIGRGGHRVARLHRRDLQRTRASSTPGWIAPLGWSGGTRTTLR